MRMECEPEEEGWDKGKCKNLAEYLKRATHATAASNSQEEKVVEPEWILKGQQNNHAWESCWGTNNENKENQM